jgi:hypothetical protein
MNNFEAIRERETLPTEDGGRERERERETFCPATAQQTKLEIRKKTKSIQTEKSSFIE